MGLRSMTSRAAAVGAAVALLAAGAAAAAEIKVMSSGGFAAAYRTLSPQFERVTGDSLATQWGPSMGNTADAMNLLGSRGGG